MTRSAQGKASLASTTLHRDRPATSFVSPNLEWMGQWAKERPSSKKPFSLKEEAKRTNFQFTQADLNLRSHRIAFVNAKSSTSEDMTRVVKTNFRPTIEATTTHPPSTRPDVPLSIPMADLTLASSGRSPKVDRASQVNKSSGLTQIGRIQSPFASDNFFIDLRGSKDQVKTGLPKPVIQRYPSPVGSASSEEVILFPGRGASRTNGEKPTIWPWPSNNPTFISDPVLTVENFHNKHSDQPTTLGIRSPMPRKAASLVCSSNEQQSDCRSSKVRSKRKRKTRKHERRSKRSEAEKDAILADYVANMDADDITDELAQDSMHWGRQPETMNTVSWQNEFEESEALPHAETKTFYGVTEEAAELEAFDELSTSDEILAEVQHIVSKRVRPSGIQYLVILEGYTVDDARWYPVASLSGLTAQEKIRVYEIEQARLEKYSTSGSSGFNLDRDEQLEQDLQDELDDLADEQDLIDRHRERMTDEHIARLFSKQEEFGLGSHDLLLYDGDEQNPPPGDVTRRSHTNSTSTSVGQPRRKGKNRYRSKFPAAGLMADMLEQDPYNGFDIMDQDRPSLRKKLKGRRGKLPVELSDSELEQTLQSQWEKDRNKKKIRKEERENLRSQGLLGKKGKVDAKVKNPNGISLAEANDRIVNFLESTTENLVLPPMSDRDRKLVHEIANTFKLTSKSFGKGNDRFPVLYRTGRTLAFDGGLLKRKQLRLFLGKTLRPRPKVLKGPTTIAGMARGAGFSKAGVSYRDGDIVGAAAPELGQENRGRAMLEKMGWSTGTALGALNNKGIMQPVAHVVKNSKAGLG